MGAKLCFTSGALSNEVYHASITMCNTNNDDII